MSYADACDIAMVIINLGAAIYVFRIFARLERHIVEASYRRHYRGPRPPWMRR